MARSTNRKILVKYLGCQHSEEQTVPKGWTAEMRMLAALRGVVEEGDCNLCKRVAKRAATV